MKKQLVYILSSIIVLFLTAGKKSDFEKIFDGKTLNGWEIRNGHAPFTIENGEIVGTYVMKTSNTFLCTKKEYSDFILTFEAKLGEGTNSGVQFRSHSTPNPRTNGSVYGYQMELDPSDRKWTGGVFDQSRRGWIYNLEYNPQGKKAFKLDQWCNYRIEAIGNSIKIWINGIQTANLVDEMDASGFIGLQVHAINKEESEGKEVRFRNIQICTENLDKNRLNTEDTAPQVSCLDNKLSQLEKEQGWEMLWDGISINGWRGISTQEFPKDKWEIDNGELVVSSSGNNKTSSRADIMTTNKYENYILEVDFKYSMGAQSGINYLVNTDLSQGKTSEVGVKYQIIDDKQHPEAKNGKDRNRSLASLYDLISADAKRYNPDATGSKRENNGKWNRARIVVNGNEIEHYLNGMLVVKCIRGSQEWTQMVTHSIYSELSNFGLSKTGYIMLQAQSGRVHFKNIKIKKL